MNSANTLQNLKRHVRSIVHTLKRMNLASIFLSKGVIIRFVATVEYLWQQVILVKTKFNDMKSITQSIQKITSNQKIIVAESLEIIQIEVIF